MICVLFQAAMRPLLTILAAAGLPFAAFAQEAPSARLRVPPAAELVQIRGGSYLTGDSQGGPGERPVRRVTLPAFQIKRMETANSEYFQCVKEGACSEPRDYLERRQPEFPVTGVSWFQARDFCLWWGGRLPSEAEWESAARSTDGRKFPWGNEFDWSRGNFADGTAPDFGRQDRYEEVAPAGSFGDGASEQGAVDLAGNAAEWVGDWFDPLYYTRSPQSSPKGPPWGSLKIVKGGSYRSVVKENSPSPYRAAAKMPLSPDLARPDVGFRCVYDGRNPLENTDPAPPDPSSK